MKKLMLLIAVATSGAAHADSGGLSDHEAPAENAPPVEISSGLSRDQSVVEFHSNYGSGAIDFTTDRIYISTPSGIAEHSFSHALSSAGLNPSGYTADAAFPGIPRSVSMAASGQEVMGPCAMSPCVREFDRLSGQYVYVSTINFDDRSRTGSGYDSPDGNVRFNIEVDMRNFDNWRQDRCESFNDSVAGSTIEAPITATGCAAFETGAGLLVCIGGVGKQIFDNIQRVSMMTDCSATYPGPGRWKNSGLPKNYGQ